MNKIIAPFLLAMLTIGCGSSASTSDDSAPEAAKPRVPAIGSSLAAPIDTKTLELPGPKSGPEDQIPTKNKAGEVIAGGLNQPIGVAPLDEINEKTAGGVPNFETKRRCDIDNSCDDVVTPPPTTFCADICNNKSATAKQIASCGGCPDTKFTN